MVIIIYWRNVNPSVSDSLVIVEPVHYRTIDWCFQVWELSLMSVLPAVGLGRCLIDHFVFHFCYVTKSHLTIPTDIRRAHITDLPPRRGMCRWCIHFASIRLLLNKMRNILLYTILKMSLLICISLIFYFGVISRMYQEKTIRCFGLQLQWKFTHCFN